ncbi:Os06g0340301, partial [Oryza sativa Japonica Group]
DLFNTVCVAKHLDQCSSSTCTVTGEPPRRSRRRRH